MSRWSVEMTIEHEYPQSTGIAINTIKVERIIDGVSPQNDCALWAAGEALVMLCLQYSIDSQDVTVIKVDVVDIGERG